jgi:DNA-binding protein
MATRVSFKAQGAKQRVNSKAKAAVTAKQGRMTSSCTLRKIKVEMEAIANETKERTSIELILAVSAITYKIR